MVLAGVSARTISGGESTRTPDSVPRAPCGGPGRRPSLSAGGCPTALAAYPGVLVGPGSPPPFWPCSGWGLPSRPGHPGRWGALTAPFHPCLCGTPGGVSPSAVCFLWHCPAGRPDWGLPSTLPCGVRTFLGPVPAPEGTDPARGRPAGSPPCVMLPVAGRGAACPLWSGLPRVTSQSGPFIAIRLLPTLRL